MGNHKLVEPLMHSDSGYRGRCSCGEPTGPHLTRQGVEDAHAEHLARVEKVRAHIASQTPRLDTQVDYYRRMSENPEIPEKDRVLWAQLADELGGRLGHNPPTHDEEPLLFDS